MKSTIFVQIASYRDPELVPTLRDMFTKAANPENLRVCIAWQHDVNESLEEFKDHHQIDIIDIPYTDSKGACWARNQIQKLYNNEQYTLQLDSHHRFVQNWDTECISMYDGLKASGVSKPLLTAYLPSYNPKNDPEGRATKPWKMNFDRFIPEGAIFFMPATIEDADELDLPVPSRFYSAHFCFTSGDFCLNVPHDPEYYFHGEEISIAVRAYTHGYDLFHPHIQVAWHEYTREGRNKHWEDHDKWGDWNASCHLRNRKLFEMDDLVNDIDFGKYGFGTERTLRDYEVYAGVNFKLRAVQKDTLANLPVPPDNKSKYEEMGEDEWLKTFTKTFKYCIDIKKDLLTEKDYDFWCVAFHDSDGKDIFRLDAPEKEIKLALSTEDEWCKIWRTHVVTEQPAKWVVWPHSVSKGWCTKIEGNL